MKCCSLEPFCYCGRLEPEDRPVLRRYRDGERQVRHQTNEEYEDLRAAMLAYAARVRRTRRFRLAAVGLVVGLVLVVMLLAGCDPRNDYVEPSPSQPTPTIMYTVILPQGGVYDNN